MPVDPGSTPRAQAVPLGGGPTDLAALAATGPALLFFYRVDCGASEAAAHVLPRLAALPGLAVAALSQDGEEETRAFARARGWGEPVRVLVDAEPWRASRAYGVRVTPTWILLAPGGRVDAVVEGWSRAEANALARRAAALAGVPAPVVSADEDGPERRPG